MNYQKFVAIILLLVCLQQHHTYSQPFQNANWIGISRHTTPMDTVQQWTCYRKAFTCTMAEKKIIVNIATDTKYWLWVNGKLVVFEGGLKRGPTPTNSYYDQVDIAKYVVIGKNTIAILTNYFGRHGFAHKSSGKAAMIFEIEHKDLKLYSDNTWKVKQYDAYSDTEFPKPNFRLAENNIRFDARKSLGEWFLPNYNDGNWAKAEILGKVPTQPWGKLVLRPTPLFKDFGLKNYLNASSIPAVASGDTVSVKLPYNMQLTPYFKIKTKAGLKIHLLTDDYYVANNPQYTSVRAEYITKEGIQEYESYGWMNGHEVKYVFPKGIEIISLQYRETGFNTQFVGSFSCNDAALNTLWKKAARTLYLNMRDNYMDCPDRERAQWWGDEVLEIGEAFYTFDTTANSLARKGILEICNWQRPNKTMYAPIPDGNWGNELPPQILATVGMHGFWTYFMYSGDTATIRKAYPHVKDYLSIWELDNQNLVIHRKGDWDWSDWGVNIDVPILDNAWYVLALQGAANMCKVAGKPEDAKEYETKIQKIKAAFNPAFWNGNEYLSKTLTISDDRANAMAVVAGLADSSQWTKIHEVLQKRFYASPYMEKFVEESLLMMNMPEAALQRIRNRYKAMIESPITTLWEAFVLDKESTYNHGWSGGALTLLSQYIAGIAPVEPGYKKFHIKPMLGDLKQVAATVMTVNGEIKMNLTKSATELKMFTTVPVNTTGLIAIPYSGKMFSSILLNGKVIFNAGKLIQEASKNIQLNRIEKDYIWFDVPSGVWAWEGM